MSIIIAYLLIGAIQAIGLIVDRWNRFDFDVDSITEWFAISWVFVVLTIGWPLVIKATDKKRVRYD